MNSGGSKAPQETGPKRSPISPPSHNIRRCHPRCLGSGAWHLQLSVVPISESRACLEPQKNLPPVSDFQKKQTTWMPSKARTCVSFCHLKKGNHTSGPYKQRTHASGPCKVVCMDCRSTLFFESWPRYLYAGILKKCVHIHICILYKHALYT